MIEQVLLVLAGGLAAAVPTLYVTRMQIRASRDLNDEQWRRQRADDEERRIQAHQESTITLVMDFVSISEDLLGMIPAISTRRDFKTLEVLKSRLNELYAHGTRARVALGALKVDKDTFNLVEEINQHFMGYFSAAAKKSTTTEDLIDPARSLATAVAKLRLAVIDLSAAPISAATDERER